MEKHYTDMTFEELAELHARDIHNGLLEGGSRGMHRAILTAMDQTLQWRMKQEPKEAENLKTAKTKATSHVIDVISLSEEDIIQAGDFACDNWDRPLSITPDHPAVGKSLAAARKLRDFGWCKIVRPVYCHAA